jgi:succinyl-CoA synthetase alpha subunit
MGLLDVAKLRALDPAVVCVGSHRGIIQSMLDFDFMMGRPKPSVLAIIVAGRKAERYFFGTEEVQIRAYPGTAALPERVREQANLVVSIASGRRTLSSMQDAMAHLPKLVGGVVFAEGFPERHAIALRREAAERGIWMLGGASVGVVVPGAVKLGAIGGVDARQLEQARLFMPGKVAVVSSSGGMVNEVIQTVARSGNTLSFGTALGGERFPMSAPIDVFAAAQADPETEAVVYFGELGGRDEYVLVDQLKSGALTKPVVCYIAGTVAELFPEAPQFGHAKAIATNVDESARAKAAALTAAGARVGRTYAEFVQLIRELPQSAGEDLAQASAQEMAGRTAALMSSSISGDRAGGEVQVLGDDLLDFAESNSFAKIAASMFLGRKIRSKELEQFVDFVLRLLVDHGPYVSGAVNTIVTARAGRDLVSALSAGLLTVGPRFGGAITGAATTWLDGVVRGVKPAELVEELASRKVIIAGIGHRKYRSDMPDPRVGKLLAFASKLERKRFTKFALGVEAETVRKKGNLILNVDGTIAAVMLDLLSEEEGYTDEQLKELVATDFFNALFVLSRSVGFMAHYFDQRRMDEGLFRLGPEHVAWVPPTGDEED